MKQGTPGKKKQSAVDAQSRYPGHGRFLPYVLNRATSALNVDFQAVLRSHGMTLLHWRVLAFLNDSQGLLGVSALSEVTGADQATLSRALTVMEKAGYIERRPDPQDQRALVIVLCAVGRQRFRQVLPLAWELHERAVAGLSDADQQTLCRLLNHLYDNIQADLA